mgnify:CR=1 FL=1
MNIASVHLLSDFQEKYYINDSHYEDIDHFDSDFKPSTNVE